MSDRPPPHAFSSPSLDEQIDRRRFLAAAVSMTAVSMTAGLGGCGTLLTSVGEVDGDPRIAAPLTAPTQSVATGLQPLGLESGRDGRLFVPTTYTPSEPLPLIVLLHGAGGSANSWFGSYADRGERARVVLLAIDAREHTWDAVLGGFGPDVRFIERALRATFARCAIAAGRIALAGFSDGASYALALGLANGDYFDHVIAYSPGFLVDVRRRGKPKLFVSHGRSDGVLPIGSTSRVIVPQLREDGYEVEYMEFAGDHEVPSTISEAAFRWLGRDYGGAP